MRLFPRQVPDPFAAAHAQKDGEAFENLVGLDAEHHQGDGELPDDACKPAYCCAAGLKPQREAAVAPPFQAPGEQDPGGFGQPGGVPRAGGLAG